MSLINNMLKDLEQRRKENQTGAPLPLDGLQPPDDGGEQTSSKQRPPYWKGLLVLLIIAILIFLAAIYFNTKKNEQQRVNKAIGSMKTSTTAAIKDAPLSKEKVQKKQAALIDKTVTQVKAHLQAASKEAIAKAEPKLESISVTKGPQAFGFTLTLSQVSSYHVAADSVKQKLNLELSGAVLSAHLPSLSAEEMVTELSSEQQGNNLVLSFGLQPGVVLQSIKHDQLADGQYQIQLIFQQSAAEAAQQQKNTVVTKVPVVLTPDEQREQAYQQAIGELANDNVEAAIAELQRLVRQYPSFLKARKSLIKLYLRDGAFEQAQEELKVALSQRPRDITLIELQAREDFLQGKYKQALKSLQSVPAPALKSNLSYYALIAALQQHLDRPMLAAQLYQQLLEENPDNSTWWMGLGIAYEAANRPNSAVDAYRKALSTGGLNPNLHAFVATRMTELSD